MTPSVKSSISPTFRAGYARLTSDLKKQVDAAYQKWKQNPVLVQYKPLTTGKNLTSARFGNGGRAIARDYRGVTEWLWVGFSHRDYERAIAKFAALGY